MVHDVDIRRIGHVGQREKPFALGESFFRERRGTVLFVERVIDVLNKFGDDFVDLGVFVGRFFGRSRNNQRCARFVDKDGVHFVDDGELVSALHALRQVVLHIVAEVVEAEFVVRPVGDVRAVRRAALVFVEIVHDHADAQSQRAVQRAHPFRVAARQVIVDRNDMHAASRQRIQHGGKRRDERFAFARLHFGDFAFVQNDAADELHIEMTHVQETAARLADQCECRYNRGLQRVLQFLFVAWLSGVGVFQLFPHLGAELRKTRFEPFIVKRPHFGFARVDGRDDGLQFLDVALVLGADKPGYDAV